MNNIHQLTTEIEELAWQIKMNKEYMSHEELIEYITNLPDRIKTVLDQCGNSDQATIQMYKG